MPKGQQQKIKEAICNVPVDCDQTCNVLRGPPEMSGIIMECVQYASQRASKPASQHASHASQQASHASQHKITLFLT